MPQEVDSQLTLSDPPNPLKKATVYTQVKCNPNTSRKIIARLGMNSQSNSQSYLKITKYKKNLYSTSVDFGY